MKRRRKMEVVIARMEEDGLLTQNKKEAIGNLASYTYTPQKEELKSRRRRPGHVFGRHAWGRADFKLSVSIVCPCRTYHEALEFG